MKLFITLIFAIAFSGMKAQDFPTYLKENAVRIKKPDSLNDSVYNLLSDFQLIMVGEMHGTNEPSKFVIGLSELLTEKGDSVQVGLEIPSEEMSEYLNENSDSSIYYSEFFAKASVDGRASFAMAEIILKLKKNPKVKIFFYDANKEDYKKITDRDSIMYIKIKNRILEHPSWKMVTLSGNVHNMLLPFKGKTKMALYLSKDKELNASDKICSLNHFYQKGTMLNNTGNGLELHEVSNPDSDYSTAVDYDNYLFLYPINVTDSYNGFYFTRNITAAKMVGNK